VVADDCGDIPRNNTWANAGGAYVAPFAMYATQNERYTFCLEKLEQHRAHNDLGQVRQL